MTQQQRNKFRITKEQAAKKMESDMVPINYNDASSWQVISNAVISPSSS